MRKTLFVVSALFVFCLVASGCSKTPSAQDINSDSDIKAAVKEKIKVDPKVDESDIEVDAEDGVVTLKGEVDSNEEADRAIQIAGEVPKVKRVNSELKIKDVVTNEDVEEHVEENAKVAEEKLEEKGDRSVTQTAEDAEITAKVKLALAKDPEVSALKIDVDTRNGEVTLTGTVKSEAEAKRAIQIAESNEGVKRVTSVLTVKP
jgi:hyperosmotically inducible periplasmic protein